MKLVDEKLESKTFAAKMEEVEQNIQTIRYATYDTFRVQKSTDNFIEKYLPFTI